jgi:hypothetical protein
MVKFEMGMADANTALVFMSTLWKQSKSCEPLDMNHLSHM